MRGLILFATACLVTGCETTPDVPAVLVDPCPSSASAPVESKPSGPGITPVEQGAVDSAVLNVLGEEKFIQYEGARVASEAWGDRQGLRVSQTVAWCASRAG